MGSSSTGKLAYGHILGENFGYEYDQPRPDWYDESEGWRESAHRALLASVGFTETEWRIDGYFDRKREAEKQLGVELEEYGTDGYRGYILAAAVHRADDYGAEEVDIAVPEGADEKLAHAAKVLGIEDVQPGWILASFYG